MTHCRINFHVSRWDLKKYEFTILFFFHNKLKYIESYSVIVFNTNMSQTRIEYFACLSIYKEYSQRKVNQRLIEICLFELIVFFIFKIFFITVNK